MVTNSRYGARRSNKERLCSLYWWVERETAANCGVCESKQGCCGSALLPLAFYWHAACLRLALFCANLAPSATSVICPTEARLSTDGHRVGRAGRAANGPGTRMTHRRVANGTA